MIQKIVFFLSISDDLSPVQRNMLDLAVELSASDDCDIYYINRYNERDLSPYKNPQLTFIDQREFNPEGFENAVFYTPVNCLSELLIKIKSLPNAKICLYSYSKYSLKWLTNNVGCACTEDDLSELLISNQSCGYYDLGNRFENYEILDKDPIVIPPLLPRAETMTYHEICNDEINIGYFGNINDESQMMLKNLVDDLNKLGIESDITIHLIGNVASLKLDVDIKKASKGRSRFAITGNFIDEKDRIEYVQNNIDLLLVSGNNAIPSANYGVPIAIPIFDEKECEHNRYVWMYDTVKNTFQWTSDELSKLKLKHHTLKEILSDIYECSKKKQLAESCHSFALKSASFEEVRKQFFRLIDKSKLTVRKCIDNPYLKKFIQAVDEYMVTHPNGDVSGFIEFRDNGYADPEPEKKSMLDIDIINNRKFIFAQKKYKKSVRSIRRIKGKIPVCFLIMFKESFPTRAVFEKMIDDDDFDPYIIVIPNISRSMQYQMALYNDAYDSFYKEYGARVLHGYDEKTDKYIDVDPKFKVLFFCNPYKSYDHPHHNIEYFIGKGVVTMYANYGFPVLKFWEEVVSFDFYNYMWKICIETQFNLDHLKKIENVKGMNGLLTGYAKMDKYAQEKRTDFQKTIIISPHHTVFGWSKLNISNFLKYSDFFLELPKLYPEIKFIFRPHPMLISNLTEKRIWTSEQVANYLDTIEKTPNMVFDDSDSYFDKFANSDAIIHDCGSFIAEYLYTKKPCCYMMKTEEDTMNSLLQIGKECMDNYYHAFSKEDIISFIDDVVLKGNDPLKESREKFVTEKLAVNYPDASGFIVDYLRRTLRK